MCGPCFLLLLIYVSLTIPPWNMVGEIGLNTQKEGKVFLNKALTESERDEVKRVLQMDFTLPLPYY